jgi:hypothetical protein
VHFIEVNAWPHAVSTNRAASLAALETPYMLVFALYPIVNCNGLSLGTGTS